MTPTMRSLLLATALLAAGLAGARQRHQHQSGEQHQHEGEAAQHGATLALQPQTFMEKGLKLVPRS